MNEEQKRKFWNPPKPAFNPWRRIVRPRGPGFGMNYEKLHHFGRFDDYLPQNKHLDWPTKRTALDVAPSVVCLISYTGPRRLFICSGIILSSYGAAGEFYSIVLTSATLVRCSVEENAVADDLKVEVYLQDRNRCEGDLVCYDFHFNLAAIRVRTGVKLQAACIGNLDDYTKTVVRTQQFQLAPHHDTRRGVIKLCPGMALIALGRYYKSPYHIMAAPGELSLDDPGLDCEELLLARSEITKNGIGGPLVDHSGYVIGVSFYEAARTPFLPINIAVKCLEHLLQFREVPRPWLGLQICDIDKTMLGELERLMHSCSETLSGIVVKKVEMISPASDAGFCIDDIIVEIDDKRVESSLKFTSVLLDKAKEPLNLKVVVMRVGSSEPLTLRITPQNLKILNRWPLPKKCSLLKPFHEFA